LRQYHESRNSAEVKRLAAYRKAITLIETRGPLVFTEIQKAQGGSFENIRKLRGLADASDKALAAIGS
jgi:hypothetical protein